MSDEARQRIDLWLYRARLAKTRAAASRLIAEGGVRIVRDGAARRLEKPSAEIAAGDVIVFAHGDAIRTLRIARLPTRRGPFSEAQQLYADAADA